MEKLPPEKGPQSPRFFQEGRGGIYRTEVYKFTEVVDEMSAQLLFTDFTVLEPEGSC